MKYDSETELSFKYLKDYFSYNLFLTYSLMLYILCVHLKALNDEKTYIIR